MNFDIIDLFGIATILFVAYLVGFRVGQRNGELSERQRRDAEDERVARVTARIEAQLREMSGEEFPEDMEVKEL